MNWLVSTLTDGDGRFDVAYVSLFCVMGAAIGSIMTMTGMSVIAYLRCVPQSYVVNNLLTVVECKYDPLPLGSAIGYVCTGFGVALGALAGYMAATRPPRGTQSMASVTVTKQSESSP